MNKILFVVIDGLGDKPQKQLGYRTPLEAAQTPNLDLMAQKGLTGLLKPVFTGSFPSSSDAHLSLFGYGLKSHYIGRGVFEALGNGVELKKGDVALRGDFSSLNDKGKIIDRRAGRIKNTEPLIKALQGIKIRGVDFLVVRGIAHRVSVVLRGKNLSAKISEGDPQKIGVKPKKIKPLKFRGGRKADAVFTAKIINEFLGKSYEILKKHPFNQQRKKAGFMQANYLLLRTPSQLQPVISFKRKWGLEPCNVTSGGLYQGIAKVLGMQTIQIQKQSGKKNISLADKIKASQSALKKYDFCYLHIKDVDEPSHDGNCLAKKKAIEKVDEGLSSLLNFKNTIIVVTADHATPCALKQHTADPVPALVYQVLSEKAGCSQLNPAKKFSEKECQKAGWGVRLSNSFMKMVVRLAKK